MCSKSDVDFACCKKSSCIEENWGSHFFLRSDDLEIELQCKQVKVQGAMSD